MTDTVQDQISEQQKPAKAVAQGKGLAGGLLFLGLGALFGFFLSRAGATTYDFYPGLFLFQNLQLLWVIAVAAGVGFVGNQLLKAFKAKTLVGKASTAYRPKPWRGSLIPGSVIFGLGWGLAGACPGTALAMLGEGKLGSLFTILGFFIGTYVYGVFQERTSGR